MCKTIEEFATSELQAFIARDYGMIGVSVRARKALYRAIVATGKPAMEITFDDLMAIRGCGLVTADEIALIQGGS